MSFPLTYAAVAAAHLVADETVEHEGQGRPPPDSPGMRQTLREWVRDLTPPGGWWPDAWRVVAPALLDIKGWPGHSIQVQTKHSSTLFEPDRRLATGRRSVVIVNQAVDGGVWRSGPLTPEGAASSTDSAGDSFFSAVLQALPWRGAGLGPTFTDPGAMRQAAVEGLLAVLEGAPASRPVPPWLAAMLRAPIESALVRRSTPAVTVIDASHGQPLVPRTGASPAHVQSGRRARELSADQLTELAWRSLNAARFEQACRFVERIFPRSEVPMSLLRRICIVAEGSGHASHIRRAGDLLECLAAPPSDLLHPSLGLNADGSLLDFHSASICLPMERGHQNFWEEGAAMCGAMAIVLYKLHSRRGRIKAEMVFGVGHRGVGTLSKVVADCILEDGLTPRHVSAGRAGGHIPGMLVAEASATRSNLAEMTAGKEGEVAVRKLERWLDQALERGDGIDSKQLHYAGNLILSRQDERSVLSCLQIVNEHATLPMDTLLALYQNLAFASVRLSAWSALDKSLKAFKDRNAGGVPEDLWKSLIMASVPRKRNAWPAAKEIFRLRCEAPGPPTVVELDALFCQASDVPALEEAWLLYQRRGTDLAKAEKVRLLETLLRRSACERLDGLFKQFLAALTALGAGGGQSVLESRLVLACGGKGRASAAPLLSELRSRGVRFGLETVRALIRPWALQEHWKEASEALMASLAHGDEVYKPTLGFEAGQGEAGRIELTGPKLYHRRKWGSGRQGNPRIWECLTVLHAHLTAHRLRAGVEILAVQSAHNRPCISAFLNPLGLALEDIRLPTGAVSRAWRVVTAASGGPAPQADGAAIADSRSASPSRPSGHGRGPQGLRNC